MSQNEVKRIVRQYVEVLKQSNLPLWRVYLFGSYAKNMAHKYSDIDIAVVIDADRNTDKRYIFLQTAKEGVELMIEPHLFLKKHFMATDNILAYEVKKSGWRAY